jgi:hypothetical protein
VSFLGALLVLTLGCFLIFKSYGQYKNFKKGNTTFFEGGAPPVYFFY